MVCLECGSLPVSGRSNSSLSLSLCKRWFLQIHLCLLRVIDQTDTHAHTHTHARTHTHHHYLFTSSPPWFSTLTSHPAHPPSYTQTHTSKYTLYLCMMSQWPCHSQLPFSCQILNARSAFSPIPICVILLTDKVVIEHVSLAGLLSSTVSIIPPIAHTPLLI